ncbi:MAG: phosphatidylglycerophosphatase A [Blastocatellia bacterium]
MSEHSPFADKRGRSLTLNGPLDALAVFLATGFGAGFMPFGPGTFGSMVGLLIAYGLIAAFGRDVVLLQNSILVIGAVLAAIGIWSGTRAEQIFGRKDAGQVVMDEVCGQVITFAFIGPYLARLGSQWRWWMIAGFVLFRLFDVFKPYPIDRLQDLEGGIGVMMDDVVAGIYAAMVLSFLLWLFA